MIHKTSIIDPKAKIADNVEIGPYCVIGAKVEIKDNTTCSWISIFVNKHLNDQ